VIKSGTIIRILAFLLPLTALGSAGVASFLWLRAHGRASVQSSPVRPGNIKSAAPGGFSDGFGAILRSVAAGYGITGKDIRHHPSEPGTSGVRGAYTVNAPPSLSLTLFHLILADSAAAHGGAVLDGIESADGRTLTLTLGASGVPTDAVIIRKNP